MKSPRNIINEARIINAEGLEEHIFLFSGVVAEDVGDYVVAVYTFHRPLRELPDCKQLPAVRDYREALAHFNEAVILRSSRTYKWNYGVKAEVRHVSLLHPELLITLDFDMAAHELVGLEVETTVGQAVIQEVMDRPGSAAIPKGDIVRVTLEMI